jgi:hypothetical protein
VIFFCLQFKQALENLISPQLIDSTQIQDIDKIQHPLITLCPRNQINEARLKDLGYREHIRNLYIGDLNIGKNQTESLIISWDSLDNISFPNVLKQIYNQKAAKSIHTYSLNNSGGRSEHQTEIIFIPKYGFCKRIDEYNPTLEIIISSDASLYMLITDPIYSSYIMPDFTSMKGNAIALNAGQVKYYDARVSVIKVCKDLVTTNFKTCVDDRIQKVFLPTMGCVPPWLSDRNQCNGHYPLNLTFHPIYKSKYVHPALTVKNLEEELVCKNLCVFTTTEPHLRFRDKPSKKKRTRTHISFQKKVSVTEKIPDYDFFKFVIDIGSSLGLWLGLSILGLWDLLINTIQWIKSSKLSKMLCM